MSLGENVRERLAEELVAQEYTPAARRTGQAPKGFEPGVKYEAGRKLVTTPPMQHLANEDDWTRAVAALGVEVPSGWRLRLVEARYDPAAWHRDAQGEDAVTRPCWRYRFAVEEDHTGDNLDELVAAILKVKPPRAAKSHGIPATQTVVWSDWQLFKAAGDGIEGTIRRIRDSFQTVLEARQHWRRQGYSVDDLVIVGNGDIVEGCAIYPHQLMHLQGGTRYQRNAGRRLIVEGIKTLAPKYGTVRATVVGGNHGENRIEGRSIDDQDNGDIEVFESAFDALAENPDGFGHCTLSVPPNALIATLDVQGWVLAHQHGHLAAGSGTAEAKMRRWFEMQAAAKAPAGDAHIFVSSHYHHVRTADWGAADRDRSGCFWVQSAAVDGGSPQFAKRFGAESAPSVTTFLSTHERRVARLRTVQL